MYYNFILLTIINMNEYLKKSLLILNIEQNNTNTRFFSVENINYIQNQLIQQTYQRTGHTISEQNCNDILQAMQYFYINYPLLTTNQSEVDYNINSLNQLVINDLLVSIVNNVKQYIYYRKNLNKFEPLEYGSSTTIKGKDSLEYNTNEFIIKNS